MTSNLSNTGQQQEQEQYSHCLQEGVAHEGLLWDSLDVVVVEPPGRQHPGAVRIGREVRQGRTWSSTGLSDS